MPDLADRPTLSPAFDRACALALELHRFHLRNSTGIAYFSHLMSVAALVLEDAGTEAEAIAALLHDALEDCSDRITGEDIETQFGPEVRRLVDACTDTPPSFRGGEKPPWKNRKERYLQHVLAGGGSRVSLADKLHNARSILRDHMQVGEAVWDRFSADREDTLWYYRELGRAYRAAGFHGYLIDELERTVRQLHARSGVPVPT